jgi:large subunit ribosomal protein L15
MELSKLNKVTTKKKRRVGLGHGSGRGKTSGRGTKGQKARGNVPLDFEGGALPLMKRLPFLRGKGKNFARSKKYGVNVGVLNMLPKDATVDIEILAKYKIVKLDDAKEYGVKILGDGELQVALTVKLPVSKQAAEKIIKAGGTVAA